MPTTEGQRVEPDAAISQRSRAGRWLCAGSTLPSSGAQTVGTTLLEGVRRISPLFAEGGRVGRMDELGCRPGVVAVQVGRLPSGAFPCRLGRIALVACGGSPLVRLAKVPQPRVSSASSAAKDGSSSS